MEIQICLSALEIKMEIQMAELLSAVVWVKSLSLELIEWLHSFSAALHCHLL
jgi:hypothetical protein